MVVKGKRGGTGVLHATMTSRTGTIASIVGPQGRLDLGERTQWQGRWYAPTTLRFQGRETEDPATYTSPDEEFGLHYEVCEAARCISDGLLESPLLPLAETLSIMQIMDNVRAQLGVRYPGE